MGHGQAAAGAPPGELPTRRFVIDVGSDARLDAAGFLRVPAHEPFWGDPGSRPQPACELAGSPASFVLLAPPAAGKTTVMDELREQEPGAVTVRPESHDLAGVEAEIADAVRIGVPVYLDHLDEAAIHEPRIFRLLERLLSAPTAHATPWRLACRPAAWSPSLAERLRASLPDFRELRLLPLDPSAATEIVRHVVDEPSSFFAAISTARLTQLPATPGRLLSTARAWDAGQPLPDGPVAALELELEQLLAESGRGRPLPSLTTGDRRLLAERLAAISLFCGKPRFVIEAPAAAGSMVVTELPSDPEPGSSSATAFQPAGYRDMLDSPLFDTADGSSLAFRHHQLTEYLAARYLIRRRIGQRALRSLLGVQPDGRLPSPMAGIAVWLASLEPTLTDGLLRTNALALARTAVELPTDAAKAAVIDGLLDGARQGDFDTEWGLDLSPLVHDGLCAQLEVVAADLAHAPELLWWIARLTLAGRRCRQLLDVLLDASHDARWPDWARSACITTVGGLGDGQQLEQLRPLLTLDAPEDSDDELLGHTLEVLYPRLLSTSEVLDVLRPPRRRNLYGAYAAQLADLADEIPTRDLPVALNWLTATLIADEPKFGQLPSKLVERAWDAVDTPGTMPALAQLLVRTDATRAGYELTRHQAPPWTGADDPGPRRRLAAAVAEAAVEDDHGWFVLLHTRLLQPDDVPWLIEQLPQLPAAAQAALATCLPMLVHEPTAHLADQILNLPADHPAFGPTERLRGTDALDSDTAQRQRARREREAARQDQVRTPEQQREQLLRLLDAAADDIGQWWKIIDALAFDESGRDFETFSSRLEARPGWRLLDLGERQRLIDLGMSYLRQHDPEPERWRGRPTINTGDAMPDWSSVHLLTTLVDLDPAQVTGLEPEIWRRLAPAIVGAWDHNDSGGRSGRGDLIRLAPATVRPQLVEALIEELDARVEHGRLLVPDAAEQLFPEAAEPLTERLASGTFPDELARQLLDMVVEHAPQARSICHELRTDAAAVLAGPATRHLARLDPVAVTDELLEGAVSSERIFDVVLSLDITALDAHRLGHLAGFLLDRFPMEDDPPLPETGFSKDDRIEAGFVRSRILNRLVEHGDHSTLDALMAGRGEPDMSVLRRLVHLARAQAANLALTPVSPSGLLQLLSRADVRMIRHGEDLMDVVLEHLDRLQNELTHRGGYQDVWNELPDGSARLKREDTLSQWVARWLQARLTSETIIDREVQITPSPGGIGTRVDLAVTASTNSDPAVQIRVIIEAKCYDHRELRTALTSQLADRYLEPAGLRHGIYLVYWVDPDQRPGGTSDLQPADRTELQKQLDTEAARLAPSLDIQPFILDMGRPRR